MSASVPQDIIRHTKAVLAATWTDITRGQQISNHGSRLRAVLHQLRYGASAQSRDPFLVMIGRRSGSVHPTGRWRDSLNSEPIPTWQG